MAFTEPLIRIPLWLELSGLPAAMNEAARTAAAWPVFLKIVALDVQHNPTRPDTVAISLRQLGEAVGVTPSVATRAVQSLRKKGWIACFIPDNDEEDGLFRVKVPLPTPIPASTLRQQNPQLFSDPTVRVRYESASPEETAEEQPDDPVLQEVIDLYFNTISMKMNNFLLDELRLIRRRFDLALIRRIFYRARDHGITSMGWLLKELHRETAKKMKEEMEKAAGEAGE